MGRPRTEFVRQARRHASPQRAGSAIIQPTQQCV